MILWPTGCKFYHRGCWRDTVEVLLLGSRMLPELAATAPPHVQGPAALVHGPSSSRLQRNSPAPCAQLLQHLAPQCTVFSGTQWPAVSQHPSWVVLYYNDSLGKWISSATWKVDFWQVPLVQDHSDSVVQRAVGTAPLTMSASQPRVPSWGSYPPFTCYDFIYQCSLYFILAHPLYVNSVIVRAILYTILLGKLHGSRPVQASETRKQSRPLSSLLTCLTRHT